MRNYEWVVVVAVLLFAGGLRTVGLSFAQPDPALFPSYAPLDAIHENQPLHPDEYFYVQRPLRMLLIGERNPDFYENPSFLINMQYVTYWLTGEQTRLTWDERADLSARSQPPFRLYMIRAGVLHAVGAGGGGGGLRGRTAHPRTLCGAGGGVAGGGVVTAGATLTLCKDEHDCSGVFGCGGVGELPRADAL